MELPQLPRVRELMAAKPVFVTPETTIQEAAVLMGQKNIGCVVVCQQDAVKGIFTERDLLRWIAAGHGWPQKRVGEVMTPDPFILASDETLERAIDLFGQTQVRHLPVLESERLVGVLSVRDVIRHRAQYLEWIVQQQTAELRAKNTALEERDRLMQHHLAIAALVQRQLLPPTRFEAPPLSLAVEYHPLDRVSGDYYDFADLPPNRLGILIADACGHSVPAALVSAVAKTVFYASGRSIQSPAALLRTMNDHVASLLEAEHFVTMFYVVVDRENLQLTYAAAGHPPPLWLRRRLGTVEPLDAQGMMIGVYAEPTFEEHMVQLDWGDTVLFYTDGLIECRSPQGDCFGRSGAEAFLRSHSATSSQALTQSLVEELARFRGPLGLNDDVTFVVLGVDESPSRSNPSMDTSRRP